MTMMILYSTLCTNKMAALKSEGSHDDAANSHACVWSHVEAADATTELYLSLSSLQEKPPVDTFYS